jgi:hypothetical protein
VLFAGFDHSKPGKQGIISRIPAMGMKIGSSPLNTIFNLPGLR